MGGFGFAILCPKCESRAGGHLRAEEQVLLEPFKAFAEAELEFFCPDHSGETWLFMRSPEWLWVDENCGDIAYGCDAEDEADELEEAWHERLGEFIDRLAEGEIASVSD